MEYRDYYATLGVSRDASADDIKKAFRKMARKYHPDVSKETDAAQRMSEVNEAYAVLSDPEKRSAYDQLGQGNANGSFRPPPGWGQDSRYNFNQQGDFDASGFSDFFSELFGRMGGGAGASGGPAGFRQSRRSGRGEDMRARVVLGIEDSFTGATRQLTLRSSQGERTFDVKIPKGVQAGQVIRLAGQGEPGPAGAGDLLLEVSFQPHPRYRVDGKDISMTLPVTPWEAALGAVVPVRLPDRNIKVRIPAGAQNGRQLSVKSHGIPGKPPGDLTLDVQVVLPPADTPQAKALYEQMAKELAFDPRNES